jgi:hypothetical protein
VIQLHWSNQIIFHHYHCCQMVVTTIDENALLLSVLTFLRNMSLDVRVYECIYAEINPNYWYLLIFMKIPNEWMMASSTVVLRSFASSFALVLRLYWSLVYLTARHILSLVMGVFIPSGPVPSEASELALDILSNIASRVRAYLYWSRS